MNPRDLEMVRTMVSSLLANAMVLDQLLNGEEPEEKPEYKPDPIERRPRLAYMGDDNPAA